ncbi:MAG: YciI family protein [bacterium]
MKYILLDYVNESGWPELTKVEKEHWLGAYLAYIEAMTKAGVLKGTTGLQPTSAATTVRTVDGKTQVLDGPYTDSKEQLGGFRIIDVADLDAALSWAARCPTALHGVVEVRPILDMTMEELLATVRRS